MYLWPKLTYRPLTGLALRAGLLYARALAQVADPYSSNTNAGGVNRNFFGGSADAHDLGMEIQLGARYALPLHRTLTLSLGVEYAHLFHGAAFADADGEALVDLDRVGGRLLLDWRYE